MAYARPRQRRRRIPRPTRRRALELLAAAGQHRLHRGDHAGARFTVEFLAELVRDGLATATPERGVAGDKTIEVAREGRRALAGD
jgi:hypothetical protein